MFGTINDLMSLHFAREDFRMSDQAGKTADSDIRYIGYLNRGGEWYILEDDRSPAGGGRTFRFIKGSGNYPAAWTGREVLSYELYDVCFG